ncbi:MAG: phage tail assembly protein [Enhydrobacter sp.]|nr:phage tail assembly protein [Enhydrobacter sp.]
MDAPELDQRDVAFVIPDTIEVALKRPLKKTASEESLTTLTFRPPTFKEIRRINDVEGKKGQLAGAVEMLILLSEDKLVEPDIDRLTALDFQLCVEKLGPFVALRERKTAD